MVARLNGVQEAAGSTPVTRTRKNKEVWENAIIKYDTWASFIAEGKMLYLPLAIFLQRGWLSSDKGVSRVLIPLSEDNLSDKIIFNNNTGYLILMLGAVGYSPVVTPHRIKQVCKPYRVVKVAAEWQSVGSLDQWSLVSWQNCYDTFVFSLVLSIQL